MSKQKWGSRALQCWAQRKVRNRLDLPAGEFLQPWLSERCWGTLSSFGPGHCKVRFKWISMSTLRSNWGTSSSPLPMTEIKIFSSCNKKFPVFTHQRQGGVGVTPFPMSLCSSASHPSTPLPRLVGRGLWFWILNLQFTIPLSHLRSRARETKIPPPQVPTLVPCPIFY